MHTFPHSDILYIIGEKKKEREHVKSSMWGKYAHFLISVSKSDSDGVCVLNVCVI